MTSAGLSWAWCPPELAGLEACSRVWWFAFCLLSALCFDGAWVLGLAPPRSGDSRAAACPFCPPNLWPCTTWLPFSFLDPFLPREGGSAQGCGKRKNPNPRSDPAAAVASGQLPQRDQFGHPHPMTIVEVLPMLPPPPNQGF